MEPIQTPASPAEAGQAPSTTGQAPSTTGQAPSTTGQATVQEEQYAAPQRRKKLSPILFIILGLFIIIVIYLVATFSAGRTTFFGRAANSGVFNPSNSYVFASPLSARVGGDKIRMTVFVLDGQGRGVPNKNVSVNCKDVVICQNAKMSINEIQPSTDNLGQAIFDLSVPVQGKYEMQAAVEGGAIPQTVTVSFQ